MKATNLLDNLKFRDKDPHTEVNLFVDNDQVVQLECLRSGLWASKSRWGGVLTYEG